jgi:hypothetical protein
VTVKHRYQLVEAIEALAMSVAVREQRGSELRVVGVLGVRDPKSQDVTFYIRLADPDGKLKGSGIEGLGQLDTGKFLFYKAEVASHLSMMLTDDCLNIVAAEEQDESARAAAGRGK